MRFFEFKLPEPGSDFAKELENYFVDIVQKAQALPETDPKRQELNKYLDNLKNSLGVKEDAVADISANLLKTLLLKSGVKEASFALLDMAKIIKDTAVQKEIQALLAAGGEQEKERVTSKRAENQKKANVLATRLGATPLFARNLVAALSQSGEDLAEKFLDLCNSGQALKVDITAGQGVKEFNLRSIIHPDIAPLLDDRDTMSIINGYSFVGKATTQGAQGPGEAFLACLIPGAKKPPKGDISIGGKTWEMKSSSYGLSSKTGNPNAQPTSGWLDATGTKAVVLRGKFLEELNNHLAGKSTKKIAVGDNLLTLSDLRDMADFRPQKLPYLRAVFDLLSVPERAKVLDAIYSDLYASVKQNDSATYKDIIKKSIDYISAGDGENLAKIQSKGSMIEYGMNEYQSENMIFYNTTTYDLKSVIGRQGVEEMLSDSDFRFETITIRGAGDTKASPGVGLRTKDVDTVWSIYGKQRQRARKNNN